jgi:hypothetical protein
MTERATSARRRLRAWGHIYAAEWRLHRYLEGKVRQAGADLAKRLGEA